MQTNDLGDATDYLSQRYCGHQLVPESGASALDFRHNSFKLDQAAFNLLQYGSPVFISSAFEQFYMLEMPLKGMVDIEFGNDTFRAGTGQALLLSPGPRFVSHWQEGARLLMLQIPRELVGHHMDRLSHRGSSHLPVFNPVINLNRDGGRQVQQAFAHLAAYGARQECPDEMELGQLVPWLAEALLLNIAFREGESIVPRRLGATPRQVKAAIDLFHARYGERLNMPDVAREVGVSERSLFDGFQRYYQRSPLAVLTDIRLHEARELIRAGSSAAEAGRRVGMPHAGRFSAAYKRAYGVSPSTDRH